MTAPIEAYRDREQTYIKHLFLEEYLKQAAPKLLMGRAPTLNYVDGLAGPWRSNDTASRSDTSFAVAINTLNRAQEQMNRLKVGNDYRVRYWFCEENPDSFAVLEEFVNNRQDIDADIFEGRFEDYLSPIQQGCLSTDSSTITFIDPTGWKLDSGLIFDFLAMLKGEMILNFMAEPIDRHSTYGLVEESIGLFLDNSRWRDEFDNMPNDLSNEEKIFSMLKERVKRLGVAKYCPHFAIPSPKKDRIKMRLMLGTNNHHGVEVFRRVQKKITPILISEWVKLAEKHDAQATMHDTEAFADATDAFIEKEVQENGVGCPRSIEKAQKELLRLVSAQPAGIEFKDVAPQIMENVAVRETDIKNIAIEERKKATLDFDLEGRERKPKEHTLLLIGDGKPTNGDQVRLDLS